MKRQKIDCETISENGNGDFIQLSYDRKGKPEYYLIFFADNATTIMVAPEKFKSIKELFWSLTKNLEPDEEVDF
jgi:hypothetical protein